jgi:hypothetical protein
MGFKLGKRTVSSPYKHILPQPATEVKRFLAKKQLKYQQLSQNPEKPNKNSNLEL